MQLTIKDVLAFALELAAIILFSRFAYNLVTSPAWLKWLLAIAAFALFAIIWAMLFAPTAGHRLTMPWLLIGKAVMLSLPLLTFWQMGKPIYSLPYLLLLIIHLVASTLTKL